MSSTTVRGQILLTYIMSKKKFSFCHALSWKNSNKNVFKIFWKLNLFLLHRKNNYLFINNLNEREWYKFSKNLSFIDYL